MLRIFSFIRNEQDVINDWLLHHANIVGPHNVYIIDNGSTDNTHHILKKWNNRGVNVFLNKSSFKNKHKIITDKIKQHCDDCFVLPLDCDEFVVTYRDRRVGVDSDQILNEFNRLPVKDGYRYKLNQLDVVPSNEPTDITELSLFKNITADISWKNRYAKTFYHSNWFVSTDQGNHHGKVKGSGDNLWTNLALLHYNIRSYDHFVEKTVKGACAYGHDKHEKLTHGLGVHYHRRYWSIQRGVNKEQLLSEFTCKKPVKVTKLSTRLKELREISRNNEN